MKRQILTVAALCVLCSWGSVAWAGSIEGWGSDNDGLISGIPAGTDFVAVTAGDRHAIALKSDKTLVGWGYGGDNRLNIPAEANNIVAIAAGLDFTLALKEDGSIIGWGKDNYDQITDIPSGNDFVAIAAGKWHGLAIREDGSAEGWGYDIDGQSTVPTGNDFMAIGGGTFHSAGVRGGIIGSIAVWGTPIWGLPDAPEGSDFTDVDCGYSHGLALRSDGTLAAWGIDTGTDGQVSQTPTDDGYAVIAAGEKFNIARKTDGSLAAWGNDDYDQVTNVLSGNSFTAIAAGTATGFAISDPGMLALISPNGGEVLKTGTMHTITWETTEGTVTNVRIEYSTDNGADWTEVAPQNEGNTHSYEWLVPVATSQECLVRVRRGGGITEGEDESDAPLTIYVCPLSGDVTGDCVVDLADLAAIASQWLESYDPFAG